MLIKRKVNNPIFFENLLIKVDTLGVSTAFILKYTPNKKIEYVDRHNSFNFSGDVIVTPIDYNKIENISAKNEYGCTLVMEVWCTHEFDHLANGSCFNNGHLDFRYRNECGFSGDGSSDSGAIGSSGEGGITSGGGDGMNNENGDPYDDTNEILVIPIDCKACPDAFDDEVVEDDQIINKLTDKADCAYNKLLSSGVSNIHNMITDLFIEFGVGNIGGRDLTFEMSTDLPSNRGGKTVPDGNGNFTILINQNLMNTLSSIEVAAILIHEISHAFLDKHYNDYNSSFNELYIKYLKDTGYSGPIHHNIMEDNFIERMAIVLQNYDSSIFSNFEDYKILASQGVFELTDVQKDDLLAVKLISRNNDTNCD